MLGAGTGQRVEQHSLLVPHQEIPGALEGLLDDLRGLGQDL